MNNFITILILTIVGGLIGWITNILAIKLLFRPIKPVKIPILNIEILGLIPMLLLITFIPMISLGLPVLFGSL